MSFTEAIQAGFRNYVNFMGRASRSEFWYWCLFAFLVAVAASNIDKKLFPDLFASGSSPFCSLFGVGFLLPNLSIMVQGDLRRPAELLAKPEVRISAPTSSPTSWPWPKRWRCTRGAASGSGRGAGTRAFSWRVPVPPARQIDVFRAYSIR